MLVDRLVHARLLVVQTGESASATPGATVELVHESPIQTWSLLIRWLDDGHGDSVFLTELRRAAAVAEHQLGRARTAEAEARAERERALTASNDLTRANQGLERINTADIPGTCACFGPILTRMSRFRHPNGSVYLTRRAGRR